MDGDGEDAPTDVPRLREKCAEEGYSKMIFGQRSKRAENLVLSRCNFPWDIELVGNYVEGTDDKTPEVVKVIVFSVA